MTAASDVKATLGTPPFDAAHLDRLMDAAGLDAILVSSKHNLHYLLGGYRFHFFDQFDAIGVSRYVPLLVYWRGKPGSAAYVGHDLEKDERALGKLWTPGFETAASVRASIAKVVPYLGPKLRIGVERAFLPADGEEMLRQALPGAEIVDAWLPLERLRAVKTPAELAFLKTASERVIDAMLAVIAGHGPGVTKQQLVEALRREEIDRGLAFEYCLVTAGTSLNRSPSGQVVGRGDILSLDSGGNYRGYIGDLCRMGIMGEPDAELQDMLAEIDAIQMAARAPIRAGALGAAIFESARAELAKAPHRDMISFLAHGMGLISHEAPRLTATGPIPYPADDAELPLAAGMVISIETTLPHPTRGFIKLEDTVAVTETGWEAYGDSGRGWNRGGI